MNQRLGLKALVIAALMLVIWIALFLVSSVIDERQQHRDDARKSIEASYAGPQQLIGPVLIRPYTQTSRTIETDPRGVKHTADHTSQLVSWTFPRELRVTGKLIPSERHHGLYNVTVYEFQGELTGNLDIAQPKTEGTVVWDEPYLALSVADVRGIVGTPKANVNGIPENMVQGARASNSWQPNLRIPLANLVHSPNALVGHLDFAIQMDLAGTESLAFAPVGDSNHIELASTWRSPLFAAQFLPRSEQVGSSGFKATWDVSSLASSTQTQMTATPLKAIDMMDVSLLAPIDPYKLSDRATKYGILFVVLTFGGFFLFEILKRLPIHPVQYLLVGFGLAIFFLLLISFSEHMAFGVAYIFASGACIGLLTFYLSFVLRTPVRGLGFGAMLATLYSAVYGLLISEDNSLILGSLMLLVVLATVMVVTSKVDWYRNSATLQPVPPPRA
jgi:inner membrane protein